MLGVGTLVVRFLVLFLVLDGINVRLSVIRLEVVRLSVIKFNLVVLNISSCGFHDDRFGLCCRGFCRRGFCRCEVGLRGRRLEARPAFGFFFLLIPAEVKNLRLSEISNAQSILGHEGLTGPLVGFLSTANSAQCLSVSTEETGAVGERPVDVQLRDLKLADSSVQLIQVRACTGRHNRQLHLARSVKILSFGRTNHIQCTVRAAEATFAVGHHRQVYVGSTDTAVGTEFTQCLAIVAGSVGRQTHSFTDSRETATAAACSQGVLERKLRFNVYQAAGHDQVLCNPACALLFKGLDLVTRGTVEFLARDVVIDLGGTFAVRTVCAADVLGVGHPCRTLFPGIAAVTAEGATLTITGRAHGTVAAGGAVTTVGAVAEGLAVTKGLAVTVAAEGTTLTITGRTVAERLAVSTIVVEGTAVIAITTRTVKVPRAALGAVTKRLAVTVATEGTTLTITGRTVTERTTFAVTSRTVTERTTFAVTSRTVTTITKRLSITIPTEGTTLTITGRTVTDGTTFAVTGRTVTTIVAERTTLTITSRTVTERTTFAVTGRTVTTIVAERTTLTITSRTITTIVAERTTLTITSRTITTIVAERTTLTITSRTIVAVPVFPGTESSRISAGIVVGAVRTAVVPVPAEVSAIAAAIAAVVLSHGGFLLLRADHWRVRSRS